MANEARHPLEAYADSYAMMGRLGDGRVSCRSVEVDIRQNMIPATVAATLSSDAVAGEKVKVKPLEWQENRFPRDKVCKNWFADTPFGTYWIEHKKKYWVSVAGKGPGHTYFDALETAKAAAQADYERRILSALEA